MSAFLAQVVGDEIEEDVPAWNDLDGGQATQRNELSQKQAHKLG